MHKIFVLAALLLALPAAKPAPPDDAQGDAGTQPTSQAWRERGVPICVARLRPIREFTPDDLETICGCTFDTYLQGHGTEPLPGLENDHVPVALEQQLLSCTAQTRPDQRSAVLRLGAVWPAGSPMIAREQGADSSKPVDEADAGPPAESRNGGESGGGFREWVRSITLPDWLTGASALLWVALGILVFGLLILKIRRRDPRNDLLGPPASMRRGAPPQPPRRPDLPR
jgi:hypothetical protein